MKVGAKIALVLSGVLVTTTLAQLAVARRVLFRANAGVRDRLTLSGLRMLRQAAAQGPIAPTALQREYGELEGFSVVYYAENGVIIAASRLEDAPPGPLSEEVRRRADANPSAPTYLDPEARTLGAAAVMPVLARGPVRYVGLYDRWTPRDLESARAGVLAAAFGIITLVALAFSLLIARHVHRRIQRAAKVVHGIAEGALGERLPAEGEDELGALARDFNRMAEALEKKVSELRAEEARRSRMFADWTHEIATPLTSVLGYLESLKMEAIDADAPTRRRYVDTAYEQARALSALAEDLATLSRLETDGLRLDKATCDLAAVAAQELEALAPAASARGVTVSVEGAGSAEADPARVAQVVRNGLTNAIRHARSKVTVKVEGRALEIADDGEGIAPEHLAHLGERFYRADPSRTRNTGGRGLGLAIARGIAEAHGGRLEVTSEVGVGTRFRLVL